MRRTKPTHEEHLALAGRARAVQAELVAILVEVGGRFGVTHRATTALRRAERSFSAARSSLDTEYHRVTTDEQFSRAGHAYYGGRRAGDSER